MAYVPEAKYKKLNKGQYRSILQSLLKDLDNYSCPKDFSVDMSISKTLSAYDKAIKRAVSKRTKVSKGGSFLPTKKKDKLRLKETLMNILGDKTDMSEFKPSKDTRVDSSDDNIYPYNSDLQKRLYREGIDFLNRNPYLFTSDDNDTWFKRRIDSILKDNKLKRFRHGKRYGLLNHKGLSRALIDGKCFSKMLGLKNKGYKAIICVDTSGSMCGDRMHTACKSLHKIMTGVKDTLDTCVLSFNRYIVEHKKFGQKYNKHDIDVLSNSIYMAGNIGSGDNCDHKVLDYALELLTPYLHDNNTFIIVLSDGQPACGCHDSSGSLFRAIARIKKAGIPILSLGIQSSAVKDFYDNYRIINKLDEMYGAMVDMFGQAIRRGC